MSAFAFDATTPYRLVVEVLFNAGQSSVSTFHILVAHEDGRIADLRTMAPQAHPPPDSNPRPSLGFVVLIVPDGISLKGRGGNVAPGCTGTGAGLAIPNKNGAYRSRISFAFAPRVFESRPRR